ncbi:glycosyl transferase family 1 [Mycolicibacterium celeriflavum]|uniref:glycosyltransferase n=1 Tax=Mycolicibacterium celeriflavum TaxID=1249101 RepID=UPI0007FDEA57|nr:glycosyltransferase [Mycolicibacterium celeriflavum]OBG17991.1 glycosyl transferase family 1 [Mycolicibacterium celeriflavum]
MKIALASYGSRGDVEPCLAIGRELQRRGHDVRMAAPPDLVGFVESVGLAAVPYGPDVQSILGAHREFWTYFFRNFWRVRQLIQMRREIANPVLQRWDEIGATLTSLADWADLLVTGVNFEQPAANVAERYGIPLATVHLFPTRANSQFLSFLPAALGRSTMKVYEWLGWRAAKKLDDMQRRQLGLPKAAGPLPRRINEYGWLEIQAYDEACFPGLAAEWSEFDGQRPFVGALVMELPCDADDEVASWISAGSPPIFFCFGSLPVESPAETLEMISSVCARLGERALVCSAGSDFTGVAPPEHVKVVDTMNYAAAFPACRVLVHHGGTGTTAIGLRAGVPTLILSTDIDQTLWGSRVKRLKVGTARRLSRTTRESLVADLRTILAPEYADRARYIATRMTKSAESVAAAANLLEKLACLGPR